MAEFCSCALCLTEGGLTGLLVLLRVWGIRCMQQSSVPSSPKDEFPPPALPTVYADGVLNLANSPHTVKFYLYRLDPSMTGTAGQQVQPFAQIVMPLNGFVGATLFFQKMLDALVRDGTVSKEFLEDMRRLQNEPPPRASQ